MTTLYFNIKSEFFLHAHLFHNQGKCSGFAILVWFDPLTNEVHHLLTAQHIPANTQKHKRDLTAESKHVNFGVCDCLSEVTKLIDLLQFLTSFYLHP